MIYLLIPVIIIVLVVYNFKKKKPQKNINVPNNLDDLLQNHVLFYNKLEQQDKDVFKLKVINFLKNIHIEAVDFKLEDLDVTLVAASAVIPVFYFDDFSYTNLSTVIIYPDYFNKNLNYTGKARNIGGMVGTGRFDNQMILSRKALHHGFTNKTDKGNTGIHEFIHLIDKLDGDVDGIPKVLLSNNYVLPWLDIVHEKMEAINKDKSDIRNYGGTSKIEFFAVAGEYFFERPKLLKRKHPELYKMMESCFVKDKC